MFRVCRVRILAGDSPSDHDRFPLEKVIFHNHAVVRLHVAYAAATVFKYEAKQ
jgi:hypothetical protein